MGLLAGKLNQTATYWAPTGYNRRSEQTFAAPVQISVRWDDVEETYTSPMGEQRRSKAKVLVDQDLRVGGYLQQGTSTETNPKGLPNAFIINAFNRFPTVSGTEVVREAIL